MSDLWGWQDFNYLGGKSGMDSRRAAFLLYDFVNKFGVDDFKIVSTEGNFQNQALQVIYKIPKGYTDDQIEDLWHAELERWVEAH